MANVSVRMFATVREAAGTPSIQLDAHDIDDLFLRLRKVFGPKIAKLLDEAASDPDRLVILLNGKNLARTPGKPVGLADGDEVAIFPPVSGG